MLPWIINKVIIIPLWEAVKFEIRNKIHVDPFPESRNRAWDWFFFVNYMLGPELTELLVSQGYMTSRSAAFILLERCNQMPNETVISVHSDCKIQHWMPKATLNFFSLSQEVFFIETERRQLVWIPTLKIVCKMNSECS